MSQDKRIEPEQPTSAGGACRRSFRPSATTRAAFRLACAAFAAMLFTPARPALAQIQTSGIFYAYSAQTGLLTPLPPDGNDLDFFFDPGPPPTDNSLTFEFNVGPNVKTGMPDEIVVGKAGRGNVVILENTVLRSEHLVIGDGGEDINGNPRTGVGTFRVTGFGATYNNDPTITALLPSVQFYPPGTWTTDLTSTDGYDLIVGRAFVSGGGATAGATGTLWIEAGGSVEIQDAVLLGNDPGTRGTIVVDGPDSFLGSGGCDCMGQTNHLMMIGQLGIGTMTISDGATVVTEASQVPVAGTVVANFGATLGDMPAEEGNAPGAGGEGTVIVTGVPSSIPSPPEVPSKWIIGGSLQLGGYHAPTDIGGAAFDIEGDDVQYTTEVGIGTLRVEHGALVSIREAILPRQSGEPLLLAIGYKGRLELDNGSVTIGDAVDADNGRDLFIQLINDGTITGSGRIDTGLFDNRYLGRVVVNAGQKLIVAPSGNPQTANPLDIEGVPMLNFGLIQVTGNVDARAELEIERTPGSVDPPDPNQPFRNLLLSIQPVFPSPASRGGVITAQHATLRFGSGLQNQSRLAFTAGHNIVDGNVLNFGPDIIANDDEGDIGDFTEILVTGPDTHVVFEDSLGQTGNADLNLENGGSIEVLQDFASFGSEISIELSRENPSTITVLGDVGLSGVEFNLKFANDAFPLAHGDAFEIINFGGEIGSAVETTAPNGEFFVVPFVDPMALPSLSEIEVSPDISLVYPDLDVVIQFADEGVYALLLDPSMVGPMGAVPPDFNGDGVVDLADLAIWEMNQGCMAGCSVLQGDADGDGDVDGDDLLFWQRNVGMPPPWSGAGSGSGNGLGAGVPEPTGLALVLSGGLLALACRRARQSVC